MVNGNLATIFIKFSLVTLIIFSATIQAKNNNLIVTIPKKSNDFEYNVTPACDVENFRKVCHMINVKKAKSIIDHVGRNNVSQFIMANGLDSSRTNGRTIIPKGYLFTYFGKQ